MIFEQKSHLELLQLLHSNVLVTRPREEVLHIGQRQLLAQPHLWAKASPKQRLEHHVFNMISVINVIYLTHTSAMASQVWPFPGNCVTPGIRARQNTAQL